MIEKIKTIINQVKKYDDAVIEPKTHLLEDLNFDSMDVMNLILELEKGFSITIEDQHLDLDHFSTVASILKTMEAYRVPS